MEDGAVVGFAMCVCCAARPLLTVVPAIFDAVLAALADVLRPAWACAACTLENEGAADFCVVCATPRGAVESAPPPARPSTEWTCAVCTLRNRAEHLACDVCGAERDAV